MMAAKKKAAAKKIGAKKTGAWSSHPIMPTAPENERTLAKLRKLCLALPDSTERRRGRRR